MAEITTAKQCKNLAQASNNFRVSEEITAVRRKDIMKTSPFKIILKVLYYLFIVLLSLILIVNLYSAFMRNVKREPMPMIFGLGTAVVGTGSMEPQIKAGDYIIIKSENSYSVGDIITFKSESGNSTTTHRIVQINGDQIITKGDANNANDFPITTDMVYGKVIKVFSGLGSFLESDYFKFGLVLALALILGVPLLISIFKPNK